MTNTITEKSPRLRAIALLEIKQSMALMEAPGISSITFFEGDIAKSISKESILQQCEVLEPVDTTLFG